MRHIRRYMRVYCGHPAISRYKILYIHSVCILYLLHMGYITICTWKKYCAAYRLLLMISASADHMHSNTAYNIQDTDSLWPSAVTSGQKFSLLSRDRHHPWKGKRGQTAFAFIYLITITCLQSIPLLTDHKNQLIING